MEKEANNTQKDSICTKLNVNETCSLINSDKETDLSHPRVSVTFNQSPPQVHPYVPALCPWYPPPQLHYWPPISYYDFIEKIALECEMIACVKRISDLFETNPNIKADIQNNTGNIFTVNGPNSSCSHVCKQCVDCFASPSYSHPSWRKICSRKQYHGSSCCQDLSYSCPMLYDPHSERCCCHNTTRLSHSHCERKESCRCSDRARVVRKGKNGGSSKYNVCSSPSESTLQSNSESEESLADSKMITSKASKSNRIEKNKLVMPHGESDCERSCNLEKPRVAKNSSSKRSSKKNSKKEEPFTRENPRFCTAYFLPA